MSELHRGYAVGVASKLATVIYVHTVQIIQISNMKVIGFMVDFFKILLSNFDT